MKTEELVDFGIVVFFVVLAGITVANLATVMLGG